LGEDVGWCYDWFPIGAGGGPSVEVAFVASKPSGRNRAIIAGAVVVVVVAVAVGGWFWLRGDDDPLAGAAPAADAYADAWQRGDLASLSFAGGTSGTVVADRVHAVTAGLTSSDTDLPAVRVESVTPEPGRSDRATAQVALSWHLDKGQEWTYEVATPLVKEGKAWLVDWTPAVVEPTLADGEVLDTDRTAATRGSILDGAGAPIFVDRPVVRVGIATPKDGVATRRRARSSTRPRPPSPPSWASTRPPCASGWRRRRPTGSSR
jgi:hypothetical protein